MSEQSDDLALLAKGWDAGYEAAVSILESAMLRLVTEGPKALESMKRPANPYRLSMSDPHA